MSSKNTILLTNENEHWYADCSEIITNDNTSKNVITLEFSKKNIRVDLNDDEDLIISIINPNCEIYNFFCESKRPLYR